MVRSLRRAIAVGSLVGVAGCGLGVEGLSNGVSPDGGGDSARVDPLEPVDASTAGEAGEPGADAVANADAEATEASSPLDDADTDSSSSNDADQGIDVGPDTDSGADAGPTLDAGLDAAPGADAGGPPADAGSDAGPCAGLGANCVVVPTGWNLVAFAPAQTAACPTGFGGQSNLVEGPNTANACSCGACTTSPQPTCTSGAVALDYDYSSYPGLCFFPLASLANTPAGTCETLSPSGSYTSYYYMQASAPAPSGGACSAPATTGTVTYTAQDRSCTPNSPASANCSGNVCAPTLTGSYEACITPATPGQTTCPAGPLGVAHIVGTSVSYSCTACSCSVSATCAGTLTMYSDTTCTTGATAYSTGVCTAVVGTTGNTTATYKSYKYAGAAPSKVTCAATAGTAQGVTLTGETTICCAH